MKYLVLIYGNLASRAAWAGMSDEQKAAGLRAYVEFNDDLDGSGERIVSERLAAPELTKQVIVRDDEVSTTDGPFAEIKEQLAGFYLLECDSEERALEIAARIPEAPYATIEVRPVMGLTGDVDFDLADL
ncbi:YciI family protein [Amycolatopsis sp. DSM 110486]|uniref:YciI family protein n=1 Tax=Amycolatopsis sp. DSM 110486 TaxID=2865832 RepID=UPI001C6A828F|nr:YciI family protein [Amycolatopsis sp. DSM 110486]QYN23689.1 YciI family protein [Amycolatopsis sp. DSM 110486]